MIFNSPSNLFVSLGNIFFAMAIGMLFLFNTIFSYLCFNSFRYIEKESCFLYTILLLEK